MKYTEQSNSQRPEVHIWLPGDRCERKWRITIHWEEFQFGRLKSYLDGCIPSSMTTFNATELKMIKTVNFMSYKLCHY